MPQCNEVLKQRAAHHGSSATLHEVLGDLGGLLRFWRELGWLDRSSGEPHYRLHVQRTIQVNPTKRQAQKEKKRKMKPQSAIQEIATF
ncbi:jg27811 [Pararge aegeria aegeria]|uniref:Jg27811 protein n=1 Tax=Pararge aegeria aegeria TaxID=348720 RepID=A0A8S4S2F1_9NEOP|nr:jg27811 [Pararge aegeria aegeria]